MDQQGGRKPTTKHTTVQFYFGQVVQRRSPPRFFVKNWVESRNYKWPATRSPATREERSRNGNSWKLSWNAQGAHRPLDQRDDFKDTKETCKSIQQKLDAETRQFFQSNKSDKGPTTSSKATKNIRKDLIHLDGDIMFPRQCIRLHLRHHGGNRLTAGGQCGTGTLDHGVNSFKNSSGWDISLARFFLLAIDGECNKYTYRAHVFLMRTLSACLSQPVVPVVLQVTVISSRIDFTHMCGSSTTWSFAYCVLPKNRHISSRNVIRYTSLARYTYTWHVHSFPWHYRTFRSSSRWAATLRRSMSIWAWFKRWNPLPSQVMSRRITSSSPKSPSGRGPVLVRNRTWQGSEEPAKGHRCLYRWYCSQQLHPSGATCRLPQREAHEREQCESVWRGAYFGQSFHLRDCISAWHWRSVRSVSAAVREEPNLHLEVMPARCRSASSCVQYLHSDTAAPVHEERVIAVREKPNLHLELYLRLASVWEHTARLRVRVWINCVTHEIDFQTLHPDTDAPLHEPIQSSQENREHSTAWFEFPRLRLGRYAGGCFSRCRWWDCSWWQRKRCHIALNVVTNERFRFTEVLFQANVST